MLLTSEIKKLGPDEKRAHARETVIAFAKTKTPKSESRSVDSFRNHFDSLKMIELERSLGVNFQDIINDLIRAGSVRVTNGYVWAP